MSKPNKCRVMCPDIGRPKMLFDTEAKALNFIKFNGEELKGDASKLRTYWCPACGGYHISSHKPKKWDDGRRTEKLIKAYRKDLEEVCSHMKNGYENKKIYDNNIVIETLSHYNKMEQLKKSDDKFVRGCYWWLKRNNLIVEYKKYLARNL